MNASVQRRSYRGLMSLPAWLLYDGPNLVASVRAPGPGEARRLFLGAGLSGTHMRRSSSERTSA